MSLYRTPPRPRRRLVVAAAYGLTSSLVATMAHAGHCDPDRAGQTAGCYLVRSALPFLGARLVSIPAQGPVKVAPWPVPEAAVTARGALAHAGDRRGRSN